MSKCLYCKKALEEEGAIKCLNCGEWQTDYNFSNFLKFTISFICLFPKTVYFLWDLLWHFYYKKRKLNKNNNELQDKVEKHKKRIDSFFEYGRAITNNFFSFFKLIFSDLRWLMGVLVIGLVGGVIAYGQYAVANLQKEISKISNLNESAITVKLSSELETYNISKNRDISIQIKNLGDKPFYFYSDKKETKEKSCNLKESSFFFINKNSIKEDIIRPNKTLNVLLTLNTESINKSDSFSLELECHQKDSVGDIFVYGKKLTINTTKNPIVGKKILFLNLTNSLKIKEQLRATIEDLRKYDNSIKFGKSPYYTDFKRYSTKDIYGNVVFLTKGKNNLNEINYIIESLKKDLEEPINGHNFNIKGYTTLNYNDFISGSNFTIGNCSTFKEGSFREKCNNVSSFKLLDFNYNYITYEGISKLFNADDSLDYIILIPNV